MLTGEEGTREHSRRALLVMALVSFGLSLGAPGAFADEPRPRPAERAALAGFLPRVQLGVGMSRAQALDRRVTTLDMWALLSWPLDAISSLQARARLGTSARARAFADEHAARVANAWRRRELALRALDAIDPGAFELPDAQLDFEEAQAELDALGGEREPPGGLPGGFLGPLRGAQGGLQ
jgi:hypothetical protein